MKRIALFVVAALTACATPQSPQEIVFQARSAQNVALRAAVEYKRLPPCAVSVRPPCSDKAIVAQIQKADITADTALAAAEAAVRTPGFGENIITSALVAAQAALAAFQTLVGSR